MFERGTPRNDSAVPSRSIFWNAARIVLIASRVSRSLPGAATTAWSAFFHQTGPANPVPSKDTHHRPAVALVTAVHSSSVCSRFCFLPDFFIRLVTRPWQDQPKHVGKLNKIQSLCALFLFKIKNLVGLPKVAFNSRLVYTLQFTVYRKSGYRAQKKWHWRLPRRSLNLVSCDQHFSATKHCCPSWRLGR